MLDSRHGKKVAVVLAGAVAKGAFEAGALSVLADAGVHVVRIVAASSGALNGVVYASAVRGGRAREGAQQLIELWRDHGSWSDAFHVSLGDLVAGRGLSDQSQLLALLGAHVRPTRGTVCAPIDLRVIVAPLRGVTGNIGDRAATTFEHTAFFDGAAFDDPETLPQVFAAAVASASFPGAFAPAEMPDVGPCVDGGTVNNTPIKYALEGPVGDTLDAIIVIAPTVEYAAEAPREFRGPTLVGHLADMLINERLYRDLREAEQVNAALEALERLVPAQLNAAQLDAVKDALKWRGRRVVPVVTIRPTEPLRGTAFSGFFHARERAEYIEAGIVRARRVLIDQGWA